LRKKAELGSQAFDWFPPLCFRKGVVGGDKGRGEGLLACFTRYKAAAPAALTYIYIYIYKKDILKVTMTQQQQQWWWWWNGRNGHFDQERGKKRVLQHRGVE